MKPWVIGLIIAVVLGLVAIAIYFGVTLSGGSSPSPSQTPTPEPEKVPENVTVLEPALGEQEPEKVPENVTVLEPAMGEQEPALGEQEPVMGCMDSMAANYDPSVTEDDGSCVDYVFDKITYSYKTSNVKKIDPGFRWLTFFPSNTCENKKDQELIDCSLSRIKTCKKLCDEKDWCKGFTTSITGEKDQELEAEGGMVCYFAKDDDEIEKFTETHKNKTRSIGYLKA